MKTDSPPDKERRTLITWLWRLPVLAAVGAAGWGVWEAYHVHFNKVRPSNPDFRPLEPQRAAGLGELVELWSTVPFTLKVPSGEMPALLLRVPEAVPGGLSVGEAHYLAFSRICTHLGCPVSLRRDLETLAVAFNYRTDAPALACPCHLSVFAPLEAGRAVSGPAREPLPRVQLELRGGELFAVGLEVRPG
jgi:arsenite oxidase small subunit